MSSDEFRQRVQEISWYHSIDLGDGFITPGQSQSPLLSAGNLPDFVDRSVLDIGAWDGQYSFLAERLGASRVVALDHYAWGLDWALRNKYWEECRADRSIPDPGRDEVDFWDPSLPGKRGFDLAREALNSKVEAVVADFMTADLKALGQFDVVLYLGVLYHITDPMGALRRLRQVTDGVAVIETEAMRLSGFEEDGLLRFLSGDELNVDFTNWFVVTEQALHGMCRAAGFRKVVTKVGPRPPTSRRHRKQRGDKEHTYRIVVHAFTSPGNAGDR
jgi:tRNA (mo5U34)-methyltransferase